MSENDRQIGGTHYRDSAKGGEQHWDMMWRLYREAWFVGSITKYLFRYRKKNGVEDLKKARHYLDKLIELEEAEAGAEKKEPQYSPSQKCACCGGTFIAGENCKSCTPSEEDLQHKFRHTDPSHKWHGMRCTECGAYRNLLSGWQPCKKETSIYQDGYGFGHADPGEVYDENGQKVEQSSEPPEELPNYSSSATDESEGVSLT